MGHFPGVYEYYLQPVWDSKEEKLAPSTAVGQDGFCRSEGQRLHTWTFLFDCTLYPSHKFTYKGCMQTFFLPTSY